MRSKRTAIGTFVEGVPDDVAKKLNTRYMKRLLFLGFAAEKTDNEDTGENMGKLSNFFSSEDHAKYTDLVEERMTEQMDAERFASMMYTLSLEKESASAAGDGRRQREAEYRMKRMDSDRSYLWELFLESEMKKATSSGNDNALDDMINEYQSSKGKKIDFEKEFAMRDAYFEMKEAEASEDYAKLSQLKQKLESMYDPSMIIDSPLKEYFAS